MAIHYYAANGKRDIHRVESEYDAALARLENGEQWMFGSNRLIVLQYLRECRRGKAKSGRTNKRICKATLYRILGLLRLLSEKWLQKEFDENKSINANLALAMKALKKNLGENFNVERIDAAYVDLETAQVSRLTRNKIEQAASGIKDTKKSKKK